MVMINRNWEQIKDLSDVLRIVSENISSEYRKKLQNMLDVWCKKTDWYKNCLSKL